MASVYNITINAGSNFYVNAYCQDSAGNPLNFSGFSVRGCVKNKYSDSGYFYNLNPVFGSLTGGLVILSGNGASTQVLPTQQYVYDCEVYNSGGYVAKILKGTFSVNPEVTTF